MSQTQLFRIQPQRGIYTGLTNNGLQMLAPSGVEEVYVRVYFSYEGEMLSFEELPFLTYDYEKTDSASENVRRQNESLRLALLELGLSIIKPIQVQKFFIVKHLIGIRQYPNSLQKYLTDGIEYTNEEIQALRQLWQKLTLARSFNAFSCFIAEEHMVDSEEEAKEELEFFKEWTAEGNFVLYSGNDYWCNSEGLITAT